MPYLTATCGIAGCPNAGIPLDINYAEPDGLPTAVICGVCGQPIEDVEDHPDIETAPEPGYPNDGTELGDW